MGDVLLIDGGIMSCKVGRQRPLPPAAAPAALASCRYACVPLLLCQAS